MPKDKKPKTTNRSNSRKRKSLVVPAQKLSAKDVKDVFSSIYMSAVMGLLSKYIDRFGFNPKWDAEREAYVLAKPKLAKKK